MKLLKRQKRQTISWYVSVIDTAADANLNQSSNHTDTEELIENTSLQLQ